MQNPELDIRRVRITSEDDLFLDLIEPVINGSKDKISPYRLRDVVPCNDDCAYAVYEVDHSILAVQFFIDDELVCFGDEEPLQFMSIEEIKLVREIGEVAIDGTLYRIQSMAFNMIDGPMECQHMVIFNLTTIEGGKNYGSNLLS